MNSNARQRDDGDHQVTILVVEDEGPIRQIVKTSLEAHGHCVVTAGDAEEALELAEQHSGPIDLVVTDMLLPGMSGADMIRRLVAARPALNVIYISGYLGGNTTMPGSPNGTMQYLPKPFTPRELLEVVRTIIG